jgi:DNA polymerase-3 subunit beta
MHIRLSVQDLSEGLNDVTRAIAARPVKPILGGIMAETVENGVIFTCTDGTLTIQTRIDAQVEKPGQTVFPGKILSELVRKLPDGIAEIKVNEKNTAVIKCLSSRTNLSCLSSTDFPMMQRINSEQKVSIPQNKFRDMIQRVIFAVATDENRQILTGCLMEVTHDEMRLVCLDGFRLALQRLVEPFDLPENTDKIQAVIPGKILSEIGKILGDREDSVCFTFDKSRLFAEFSNTCVSSTLLVGEFINYRQILPIDWTTRIKVNRDELGNALERASLMAREGIKNLIKMSISEDEMTITSNAEMGDVRETLSIAAEGGSMEIAFNARYLSDVIRNIPEGELCMRFNSSVSPCVICPSEGDLYTYLVLPVKIS